MTFSDDLSFNEQSGEFESAPSYPVAFGITFTPKIIGILIGVAGIGVALYIILNMLMPAWDNFQQKETKRNDLQGQIDQKKASINQIGKVKQELADAKQQQIQVLSLFANEKTLNTLLLDLNRLVEAGNTQIASNGVRAKLRKFSPTDSSYGALVNNKLKRSITNIEINGTYEQTQAILRNIERLQPLLIVKDYKSVLQPPETPPPGVRPRLGPAAITSSFQLQALMPLSPEEIAANAAAPPPAK
ncbi:MAG: pilus assembly protein PilO [Calothrix sp. SM1_7_51]|nr:pilus assembly protein PilO [Calothrix sp. SM1_7_51]